MKKILLFIVLALTSLTSMAEFRWGPTAGLVVSNYYWREPLLESHKKCGFDAGLMGEIMIPGIGFGIDFALRYNMHSATVNLGDQIVWSSDGYENQTFTQHSLELPINLRFKWTRLDGFEHYAAPFAFVGPVFSFNVGKSTCKAIEQPECAIGLQFGLGGEFFEHLQLSASYVWGVTYAMRTVKLENLSGRHSYWNVSLAYLF